MNPFRVTAAAVGLAMAGFVAPVAAQDVVGGYAAWIGIDDLYNSEGARLSQPWQVLRQDRANYHRYNIWQDGDEWDPFFEDANNRAAMEQMILNGYIDPGAARAILQGDVMVYVTIYGQGGQGDYLSVEVY